MTEMVERVARAICKSRGWPEELFAVADCNKIVDATSYPMWQNVVGEARAAIEAMREPTEAMVTVGSHYSLHNEDYMTAEEDWRAMIDAALGKTQP